MNIRWAYAALPVKIPGTSLPASTAVPFVAALFLPNRWTFGFAFLVAAIIIGAHVKGHSVTWFYRRFRSWWRHEVILARPVFFRRRFNRIEDFDAVYWAITN